MALDLTGSDVSFANGIVLRQYEYKSSGGNGDANNITTSGIYTGSFSANVPVTNTGAAMLVINQADASQNPSNTNYIFQIFVRGDDDKMYFRRRNGGNWGKWQLVTSTQVN